MKRLVILFIISFCIGLISANIYSDDSIYGVSKETTGTTTLSIQVNSSWNETLADSLYVNTDGDTMTGDLHIQSSTPSLILETENAVDTFNIDLSDGGVVTFLNQVVLFIVSNVMIIGDLYVDGNVTADNFIGLNSSRGIKTCENGVIIIGDLSTSCE